MAKIKFGNTKCQEGILVGMWIEVEMVAVCVDIKESRLPQARAEATWLTLKPHCGQLGAAQLRETSRWEGVSGGKASPVHC